MDDDKPEEELLKSDSSDRFSIDERFNFSLPESVSEEHDEGKERRAGEDAPKPANEEVAITIISDPALNSEDGADSMIGRVIGNYQVISELGRGGFGSVYKAKDTSLNRYAALKFLRFPLDREYRKLFSREAQVIANLGKHPNIVQIYQWGEYCGSHYFALEYLDMSADKMLSHVTLSKSNHTMPVRRTLESIAECADALKFAHENGVLHLDIKPANILIDSKTNKAKLCDFGLAKFHHMGTGTGTESAIIAGSPPYMSPEQISGKEVDERTDIYSLGVTLYELLSGELPFSGDSHIEIIDNILGKKKPTPLSDHRPDLSEAVLELVETAMAFQPEDRFATASKMHQAIKDILEQLEISGSSGELRAARTRKRRPFKKEGRKALAGVTLAVLASLFAATSINWPGRTDRGYQDNPFWPIAIAEAKEQIESEDYDSAITSLQSHIESNPGDDQAHYALGYAYLFTDDFDNAESVFEKVSDAGLRGEGMAAAAHARSGEQARSLLQSKINSVPTRYPAVLIALLDVGNKDYVAAMESLRLIDYSGFHFKWQQIQYQDLVLRIENALAGTSRLSHSIQKAELKVEEQKLDSATKESVRQQIAAVRKLASELNVDKIEPASLWTSRRPFGIRISPSKYKVGGLADESGLANFFPTELASLLEEQQVLLVEIVDRESIGDVLYEQELSSLSSDKERAQLLMLSGAKFMLNSEFLLLKDKRHLRIKVIDIETTKTHTISREDFDADTDFDEFVPAITEKIIENIVENYPIQGILTKDGNEARINIGTNVGVELGMIFSVMTGPDTDLTLDKISVTVDGEVLGRSAAVVLDGFNLKTIPDDGWYVQERR